jgi:hypothetical protein
MISRGLQASPMATDPLAHPAGKTGAVGVSRVWASGIQPVLNRMHSLIADFRLTLMEYNGSMTCLRWRAPMERGHGLLEDAAI